MRLLKFIVVPVGALLLVFFIVFGFNLDALVTLSKNSDDLQEGQQWVSKTTSLKGLTEYIGLHPERTAVVSRSAVNPDTTIAYGADKRHTMGALTNFFLITTFAREVEEGSVDPDTLISLSHTDAYQLPYIDSSNHEHAKSALENQGIITGKNKVALKDLVQAAITFNDLAISDFLYYYLGEQDIRQTYRQLEVTSTDLPVPFSGLYITINPAVYDTTFEAHYRQLSRLSERALRDTIRANARRYQSDAAFRREIDRTFNATQGLAMQFKHRRDALTFFPQSTARELSELMVRLQQNKLINAKVSKQVKELMNWPYERQSLNNDFEYYGAIYDSRLGLLNGLDYGASTYSGEPFGQAVFFDSLQVAFWFHMSSNLIHQDYQQRLIWDPALRTATIKEIQKDH